MIIVPNKRFGWLVAVRPAGSYRRPNKEKSHGTMWHCQCLCGNEIDVNARNLRTLNTRSCGCLRRLLPAAKRIAPLMRVAGADIEQAIGQQKLLRVDLLRRLVLAIAHGVPIEAITFDAPAIESIHAPMLLADGGCGPQPTATSYERWQAWQAERQAIRSRRHRQLAEEFSSAEIADLHYHGGQIE